MIKKKAKKHHNRQHFLLYLSKVKIIWDLVELIDLLLGPDSMINIILDRDRIHSPLLANSQRSRMASL